MFFFFLLAPEKPRLLNYIYCRVILEANGAKGSEGERKREEGVQEKTNNASPRGAGVTLM